MNEILARHRRREVVMLGFLRLAAGIIVAAPLAITLYLGFEASRLFVIDHVSLPSFLLSPVFDPDGGKPGIAAFIFGSIAVTIAALVLGSLFGFATAIFLAEFAGARLRRTLRTGIEILAGIPSVVFGWIGLSVIVPAVRQVTHTAGFGLFSAAIVLGVMILPTLITLAIDVLRAVPQPLRENSHALGATRTETVFRVVVPAARGGLIVAFVLAAARAIGETLAVQMVIGNAGVIPRDVFHAAATLPTEIVIDMGGAPPGSLLQHALFAMAFVLLCISTLLIAIVRRFVRSEEKQ